MYVGIKYCGGCNPTFDREGFVRLLKEKHKDVNFEVATETWCYELILLVNGCPRVCTSDVGLEASRVVTINSIEQFNDVNILIDKLKNERKGFL